MKYIVENSVVTIKNCNFDLFIFSNIFLQETIFYIILCIMKMSYAYDF